MIGLVGYGSSDEEEESERNDSSSPSHLSNPPIGRSNLIQTDSMSPFNGRTPGNIARLVSDTNSQDEPLQYSPRNYPEDDETSGPTPPQNFVGGYPEVDDETPGPTGPPQNFVGGYPEVDDATFGPTGPPQNFVGGYPEVDDKTPGPTGPPQNCVGGYPEVEDETPGPSGPPQNFVGGYPEVEDETPGPTGQNFVGGYPEVDDYPNESSGFVIGDDPDEIAAQEASEFVIGDDPDEITAQEASEFVIGDDPDEIATREASEFDRSQQDKNHKISTILDSNTSAAKKKDLALYTDSNQKVEIVTVVKRHPESEGGGYTVLIPSLGRERQTVGDRLSFDSSAIEQHQLKSTPSSSSSSFSFHSSSTITTETNLLPSSSSSSSSSKTTPKSILSASTSILVNETCSEVQQQTKGSNLPQKTVMAPVVMSPWQSVPANDGSGQSYYWNPQTNETTWTPPLATQLPPPVQPHAMNHFNQQYYQQQQYGAPQLQQQGQYGQSQYQVEGGGGGGGGKKPWDGLTGAARRDAKRKAAGMNSGARVGGGGDVKDVMDVSHESYSTDFQCMTEDQTRRQKIADARSGYSNGPGIVQLSSQQESGKALPSPGDILRLNAGKGLRASGGVQKLASTPAVKTEPTLNTKEDIMRLIAEEDAKYKSTQANLEAHNAFKQKASERAEKKATTGKGEGKGGKGKEKSASGGKGVKGAGGKGGKSSRPHSNETQSNGSWMNIKKSKKK